MPPSHPTCLPAHAGRARRHEAALGLVEIIVVLLIIAVLLAVAIGSFRGTKRTNHYRVAQAAAVSYAESIEAYMADNGQRPPRIGQPEWPATPRTSKLGGPVDSMLRTPSGAPRRYMPQAAPEAVSNGLVDLVRPGEAPAARAQAWITYVENGSNYTLRVTGRQVPGESRLECVVTNAPTVPPRTRRCA